MIRFYIRFFGIFLIFAGILSGVFLVSVLPASLAHQIGKLPDHDYIPEIQSLIKEKKFGEARALCDDVLACGGGDAVSVRILRDICNGELKAIHKRLLRAGVAFVSGNPGSSLEEAGAAVLSDMIMYGDLRDLFIQGWYKITGKETDWFVAALAAAGLASEAVDAVDWVPACLKALRRTAAVSDPLAKSLLTCFKNRRMALTAVDSLKSIYFKGGFIRMRRVVGVLESAEDLASAAKTAEKFPGAACLIARSARKNAPEVFRKMEKLKPSETFLKRFFLKGPNAVTLLLRGTKSVQKGTVSAFFRRGAGELLHRFGPAAFLLPLGLTAAGVMINFRRSRKRRPPVEETNAE